MRSVAEFSKFYMCAAWLEKVAEPCFIVSQMVYSTQSQMFKKEQNYCTVLFVALIDFKYFSNGCLWQHN